MATGGDTDTTNSTPKTKRKSQVYDRELNKAGGWRGQVILV
jgi:hypothetical protein